MVGQGGRRGARRGGSARVHAPVAHRRRRALTVNVGVVVALAMTSACTVADGAPHAPDVSSASPSSATEPTPSSSTPSPKPTPADDGDGASQPWGAMHVMSQQPNRAGSRPVLYLTRSRELCIGTVDVNGQVSPSQCRVITAPPPDAFSDSYAWSMEGDLPSGIAAHEFIAGVVAADVTKVVARTERGDLTAHLAAAPDPALGQLYWVETAVPVATSNKQAQERSRTAYRGTRVVFTCAYVECVGR